MRRLILGEMANARDLGGYPTLDGKYTKYGRFLRSDNPQGLTQADYDKLISMDITTIIDLRSNDEIERTPDPFAEADGFIYLHLPAFGESIGNAFEANETSMAPLYITFANNHERMLPVLRAIAHAPGGVLFHCTAGKDRTGVIASLLLWFADVHKADIMGDYILTQSYLRERFKKIFDANPDFPYFMSAADLAFVETYFETILEKYGTAKNYAQKTGLSDDEFNLIRAKLLD